MKKLQLCDTLFVFAFLPVFMGVYILLPRRARPVLIALGNGAMLLSHGVKGAAAAAVCLAAAFLSGLFIGKKRSGENMPGSVKAVFAANVLIAVAALLFFSPGGSNIGDRGSIEIAALRPFSLCCAVIPLHWISYLTDVYRGDRAAQKNIAVLGAYMLFFPSCGAGPVMKYKSFSSCFEAPRVTRKKLAAGIRSFVVGLAVYVMIAQRLEDVWTELSSVPRQMLGAGVLAVAAAVYYTLFFTSVMGLVMMGRGVALMLGFPVIYCFRRRILTESLSERLTEFNAPLGSWLRDYVKKPLRKCGMGRGGAAALCIMAGVLWYDLSAGWLTAALLAVVFFAVQQVGKNKKQRSHPFARTSATKLMMVVLMTVCALSKLDISLAKTGAVLTEGEVSGYFDHLVQTSAAPVAIGVLVTGSVLPGLLRKMDVRVLRSVMPLIELLLLMLSTSFVIAK